MKRIVVSSVIGTAVEWYDFLIYGTASALIFDKLFFPLPDPALGIIAAFGARGNERASLSASLGHARLSPVR